MTYAQDTTELTGSDVTAGDCKISYASILSMTDAERAAYGIYTIDTAQRGHVDADGALIEAPAALPNDLQGASEDEKIDGGFWPLENNDQVFDAETEMLDDEITYTPVKSRQVVKTRRLKRDMIEEELLARARAANPVPPTISDRQFAQVLAMDGLITEEDALAWVKVGTVPADLQALVDAIPDDATKFSANMLLGGATEFNRDHPMVGQLGAGLQMTPAQIDDIWRVGATL